MMPEGGVKVEIKSEPIAESKCLEMGASGSVDVADDNVPDDSAEDVKSKNDAGPGTRSGNSSSSTRGKGGKRSRGRSKKIGSIAKMPFSKGRGRRTVYKKQVCLCNILTTFETHL